MISKTFEPGTVKIEGANGELVDLDCEINATGTWNTLLDAIGSIFNPEAEMAHDFTDEWLGVAYSRALRMILAIKNIEK